MTAFTPTTRAPIDPAAVDAALGPFGTTRMLPAAAYTSPGVLAWEQRELFDRGWVAVARSTDLAEAGAQRAVPVGSESVLVVRGDDGALRGFANLCRHRGHELLACGEATTRGVLQCPYHAWSYELDGRLRLAPRFGPLDDGARDGLGLLPVRVQEWRGWLFVNLSGDAAPLADAIGDLDSAVAPWEPERLVTAATHTYELAANWKIPHENYNECYHCPLIHPELCRVSPPDSGDNVTHVSGLWVGGDMTLADGVETMSITGQSGGVVLRGLDERLARRVLYVSLFPNLLISLHPDYVMTHRIEPMAPDRTRVECSWLFAPEAVERDDFDPSYAVEFWDLTNRQDWGAVESVQRGLASSRFVPGLLGESEDAVHHFVTMVARAYAGRSLLRHAEVEA